jgi:hypothetical protein
VPEATRNAERPVHCGGPSHHAQAKLADLIVDRREVGGAGEFDHLTDVIPPKGSNS